LAPFGLYAIQESSKLKKMNASKNVFAIVGSANKGSVNQNILENIRALFPDPVRFSIYDDLSSLPHFNPLESINNPPSAVVDFRERIQQADAIIICTPEYVFSIPAILKNAIEWCVSTTVFSDKPVGLITASTSGVRGHDQLKLIMNTLAATTSEETNLLISGVKSKINVNGEIQDQATKQAIARFVNSFTGVLYKK
jgi:chromate reductase, NAD(P)H dehydrogenase (quinone)